MPPVLLAVSFPEEQVAQCVLHGGVQLGFSQASLEGTASEEWWRERMWEIFEHHPQSYSPTATDRSKCMASFLELL